MTLYTQRAALAAGEELHAVVCARTAADPASYPELRARGITALRREGQLAGESGRVVAMVASVYLPGRVPVYACRLLARTAVPLGSALEPYGAWRDELEPSGGWTRGLLYLPGCPAPVAMAWELAL